jgi:N-acetyl-gamma-glutamyl-phosphate reductase
MKINIAILGATGISGGELCRLLLIHANIGKIYPVSRQHRVFDEVHPNLTGSGLKFFQLEEVLTNIEQLDLVFFCTPSGEAMKSAKIFLSHGVKVVDLSADFRFKDPEAYQLVHGCEHQDKNNLAKAVSGVSELYRDQIKNAELIANPGCYVITALLALTPLMRSNYWQQDNIIHVHAINGTSGAGATPKPETMHVAASNNLLPYSLDGHRHAPELESQLSTVAKHDVRVVLSTAHGSFARGIYIQATIQPSPAFKEAMSRGLLLNLYREYYGENGRGERFVMLMDLPRESGLNQKVYNIYPGVARVVGSNYCHIGMDFDGYSGMIKIIAVTDNLVKGASGSAIQNMNLMFGFDESEGLRHFGL